MNREKGFFSCLFFIYLLNLYWFIYPAPPLLYESPFRIVIGSIMVFLLPGLLWGEVFRYRSGHFLVTIAISFVLTMLISIVSLFICLIFKFTITAWSIMVLLITLVGFVCVFLRLFVPELGLLRRILPKLKGRESSDLVFMSPIVRLIQGHKSGELINYLFLLLLIVLAFATYRWGEDLDATGMEKYVHLSYVRAYYSLPLNLYDLGLSRGVPAANFINLWEFLIAGWAKMVNIDPLPLYFRARFVIPVLALSGLFLLVSALYKEEKRQLAIFFGGVMMTLGTFVLLSPSPLDRIKIEQFRGLMSFFGNVHHADSANDILIALGAGLTVIAITSPSRRHLILLVTYLITAFLWHPRELFINGLYMLFIAISFVLIPEETRRGALKSVFKVIVVYGIVAVILGVCMYALLPPLSHGYDEIQIKRFALNYALNTESLLGIRNLFYFPLDLTLSSTLSHDVYLTFQDVLEAFKRSERTQTYLWLVLSALSLCIISLRGNREDRRLFIIFTGLWVLTLAWNAGMLLTIVLTYSEFHVATVRVLFVFSYILIPVGIINSLGGSSGYDTVNRLLFLSLAGIAFSIWWQAGIPGWHIISWLISVMVILSCGLIIWKKTGVTRDMGPLMWAVIGITLFFVPILYKEYVKMAVNIFGGYRAGIDFYGKNDLIGYSPQLSKLLRDLPPGNNFFTNITNSKKSLVSIYSPQYLTIWPGGAIVKQVDLERDMLLGRNPIFNNRVVEGYVVDGATIDGAQLVVTYSPLKEWRARGSIGCSGLERHAFPLICYETMRDKGIWFERVFDNKGDARVRVYYDGSHRDRQRVVRFGFSARLKEGGVKGFRFTTFEARVRNSDQMGGKLYMTISEDKPNYVVSREIIDRQGTTNRLTKAVTRDARHLYYIFHWEPLLSGDWIEVGDVNIYTHDEANYHLPQRAELDHKEVDRFIALHEVDYILATEEFYPILSSYFKRRSDRFILLFDNSQSREVLVRTIRG